MSTTQGYTEGRVARAIEQQTKVVPSDWFMWAALGSMCASLALKTMRRDEDSMFIGQWVPTLLIFGLYNKLVKVHGSDPEGSSSTSSQSGGSQHARAERHVRRH